jgi:hypothetical protein
MGQRRGAASLEYALVLPVLFALLFGLVDWSWYLFEWMTVTRAAGQGLRIATGIPADLDPTGRAEAEARRWLETGLMGGAAEADVAATLTAAPDGTVLELTIQARFTAPIGLVWTPDRLRATAQGVWYGDQFAL